ncbi:unnamed protein product [Psylliodes chrysocephalus]|uniref:Uncharacterized protein n=1 Tax=Psylliodes chrysocephalus TaxID=3402493 RepID=A0A9P0CUS6_9CUCU|nr:unnamed protein product [Psylliodes chrysocephala]
MFAKGKKHLNSDKKIKKARKPGNNCKYNYKCFERVTEKDRACILKKFNEIGDKILQDTYLSGLILVFSVSRVQTKDGSGHSRTVSNKYSFIKPFSFLFLYLFCILLLFTGAPW